MSDIEISDIEMPDIEKNYNNNRVPTSNLPGIHHISFCQMIHEKGDCEYFLTVPNLLR